MRPVEKINEIIIHCSATEAGKDFTAADIRRWHKESGFLDIGYHYVIRLDGTVEKGRDECMEGAHCKGHNKYSIGICYIGGLQYGNPSDTRTESQKKSLERLTKDLMMRYPGISVHGHNEYETKECPCFDVKQWIKTLK